MRSGNSIACCRVAAAVADHLSCWQAELWNAWRDSGKKNNCRLTVKLQTRIVGHRLPKSHTTKFQTAKPKPNVKRNKINFMLCFHAMSCACTNRKHTHDFPRYLPPNLAVPMGRVGPPNRNVVLLFNNQLLPLTYTSILYRLVTVQINSVDKNTWHPVNRPTPALFNSLRNRSVG